MPLISSTVLSSEPGSGLGCFLFFGPIERSNFSVCCSHIAHLESFGSQSLTAEAHPVSEFSTSTCHQVAERQNQVTTINQVIPYLYAQTAAAIHELKTEAYKSTTHEKYGFRSPDAKTFRNKRPDQQLMDAGWIYTKVKFQRLESYMSPRHERWQEYQNAKRRATLLLAMRLILKARTGIVPDKEEISALLSTRILRSHARTASAQKSLAYAAYRRLRKLENRLRNQPERFADVQAWIKTTEELETPHV